MKPNIFLYNEWLLKFFLWVFGLQLCTFFCLIVYLFFSGICEAFLYIFIVFFILHRIFPSIFSFSYIFSILKISKIVIFIFSFITLEFVSENLATDLHIRSKYTSNISSLFIRHLFKCKYGIRSRIFLQIIIKMNNSWSFHLSILYHPNQDICSNFHTIDCLRGMIV